MWFRGKDIVKALGYSIPHKTIRDHVDPEDRLSLECLSRGGSKTDPLKTRCSMNWGPNPNGTKRTPNEP